MNMLYITIHDIKHIESNGLIRDNVLDLHFTKLSGKTKPVKTLSTNLIEILLAAALATVAKTLDRM